MRTFKTTKLKDYDLTKLEILKHNERYYKLVDKNKKLIAVTLFRTGAENIKQLLETLTKG